MAQSQKAHVYPNHFLENVWREKNWPYTVCWEMKGPPHTGVAWMVGYALNGRMVIVQTYKEGGWEVYTPGDSNELHATVEDVAKRCGLDLNERPASVLTTDEPTGAAA